MGRVLNLEALVQTVDGLGEKAHRGDPGVGVASRIMDRQVIGRSALVPLHRWGVSVHTSIVRIVDSGIIALHIVVQSNVVPLHLATETP
jgi:hypothetical protein